MAPPKIPGAMIAANCPVCGKAFTYKRSSPVKTCSRACYLKTLPPKIETTCPACGKVFAYHQSWPRKYCSNTCKGKATIINIPQFAPSVFIATCEQCGKEFKATPKATRGRFCSRRCYGDWLAINWRGEAHPKHGKQTGRPANAGPIVTKQCPVCDAEFVTKASHAARRRCCSKKCYAQWASDNGIHVGPNSGAWKGGRLPYYGPDWHPAKRATRERDQVCLGCGVGPDELGRELDVHHLTPFRDFGLDRHTEANRLDNLVALCPACHKRWEHCGRRP